MKKKRRQLFSVLFPAEALNNKYLEMKDYCSVYFLFEIFMFGRWNWRCFLYSHYFLGYLLTRVEKESALLSYEKLMA